MSGATGSAPFQQAPIAIAITDTEGRLSAVNEAFAVLFGVPSSLVNGTHMSAFLPPSEAAWSAEIRRRVVDGEVEVFRSIQPHVIAGGATQRLDVVLSPLRDADGQRTGLIATFDFAIASRPVDDDSYLQRVLAASQSSLLTLDAEGVVHSTGGRYGDALGYPVQFWHGRRFAEIVDEADRERFDRFLANLADRPNTPIDLELTVRAADGSSRVILASASNLLGDPAVTAIVMSFQDVSELHDRITELVDERQTAEGIARDRADLIATVSHELRNPLHALQGLAEILATSELPADLTEVASELHEQLSGLASVTSDLLETARADGEGLPLHPEPTEVRGLLQRGLQYGRAAVGSKEVDVKGHLEPNTPDAVIIDRARTDQILRNLVGNAAKFTRSGSINITIGPIAHGLHITVADSGSGIPQADQAKILEPFARGSNSGGATGAGLGLAIVNDLARAMGGAVYIDSRVGRGSTFRVEVQAPKSLSAPAAQRSADDLETFDIDVLVVDDDRTNRMIATRQLERFGCRVVTAESGEQAIAMLGQPSAAFPVDVVLMDRRMPGIDGATTTLAIRKMQHRADVYVVGLTASASAAEQAECQAATMDDFVAKPASLFDLHAVVERFFNSRPAGSGPAVSESGHRGAADRPGSTVTAELIDRNRVTELVEEFGDPGIVSNLLAIFGNDLPDQLSEMRTAQLAGDLDVVGRLAHTIKGSAAMLGAGPLESAARSLEAEPGGDLDEIERLAIDTRVDLQQLGATAHPSDGETGCR